MPQSARPGDVLADRYLLVDLLSESGTGRFWRAHDKVLDRHVALHCIAEDDPRAERLNEAARLSATVLEPRILRVLDADRRDGMVYVVNEWGSGTSLDILVGGEGPLSPRRAAWIVSEVAASMAVAHERRIPHGRLAPENVLIDQSGSVRVIGFCVDAALHGRPVGELSEDVTDLGGLLYFLLTGKWAGHAPSVVPPALRDHDRWLRPRQVRAGIPRVLDTLCDHVLNPYSAEPAGRAVDFHTARGLAEALREYVGDPTGLIVPAPGNGVLGGGVLAVPERRTALPDPPAPPSTSLADPDPTVAVPPLSAELPSVVPPDTATDPVAEPPMPPEQGPLSATTPPAPAEPAPSDPAPTEPVPFGATTPPADIPTQAGLPIFDDDTDDVSWLEKREKPPPPPAFEDPPERPLFAPEPSDGGPVRRARPGAPPQTGEYWPWDKTGPNTGSGIIPVTDDDPDQPEEEVPGRSWLRLAGLIAAALLLLLALVVAYNVGRGKTPLGAEPDDPGTTPPTTPSDDEPAAITGTTATDLDPQGDPPEEYPELAPAAVDGDPATAWRTSTYEDQLAPPLGIKTGVGLTIDLGSTRDVSRIDLTLVGTPTEVSYFLTDVEPTGVAGLTAIESLTADRTNVRTELDEPVSGRYLVVWLTELPEVDGGFRGEIAEVVVSE